MSAVETITRPAPRSKSPVYRFLGTKDVSESSAAGDDVSLQEQGQQGGAFAGILDFNLSLDFDFTHARDATNNNNNRCGTSAGLNPVEDENENGPALNKPRAAATPPAVHLAVLPISPLPLSLRDRNARFERSTDDDENKKLLAGRTGSRSRPFAYPLKLTAISLGTSLLPRALASPVARSVVVVDAAVDAPTGPGRAPEYQQQLEEEAERRHSDGQEATLGAALVARLEKETDRILAHQSKMNMARQQMQVSAARPPSPSPLVKQKNRVRDKLAFLARRRKSNESSLSSASHVSVSPSPSNGGISSVEHGSPNSLEPSSMTRGYIERDGQGIVPQADAPRDASNGVGSKVAVHCRGVTLSADVDKETTAVDVLRDFSSQVAEKPEAQKSIGNSIDVKNSLVVEAYTLLGVKRRLRYYERVRDTLNSWDQESDNTLLVLPDAHHSASDADLHLANVPPENKPPNGFVLSLYYSGQPGKWSKRFITLLPNGQMFSSKKANAKVSDKDALSLCHLSDYDIYLPVEAKLRRRLKAPKKYCYAIKSQQKTTVFIDPSNYVHFFSTDDADVAQKLHKHVHAWRSHYLVHKRLELHKKPELEPESKPEPKSQQTSKRTPELLPKPEVQPKLQSESKPQSESESRLEPKLEPQPESKLESQPVTDQPLLVTTINRRPSKAASHVRKSSDHKGGLVVHESPLPVATFEPLIDLTKPIAEIGNDWVPGAPRKLMLSLPERSKSISAKRAPVPVPASNSEAAFSASSLLGNEYYERKQAQLEEEWKKQTMPTTGDSPFTAGPSLINSIGAADNSRRPGTSETKPLEKGSSWFPSALEHSAKQRSVRPAPIRRPSTSSEHEYSYYNDREPRRQEQYRSGPLVNLTPSFVEAQQWSRDGHGRGVRAPKGTMLVDLATSPMRPPGARIPEGPPRNLVRRDTKSGGHHQPRPSNGDSRPMRRPTIGGNGRRSDGSDLPPPMPRYPMAQPGYYNRDPATANDYTFYSGPPPQRSHDYRPSMSNGGPGYPPSMYSAGSGYPPSSNSGGPGYSGGNSHGGPRYPSNIVNGGPGYPPNSHIGRPSYSPPIDRPFRGHDSRAKEPPRYVRSGSGSILS
ncbi:hypothetical protein B0H63DRAFT_548573 [Podospora didyma]|uniref:PH domain-containing protein n=1 Tax=Podospora didyma TaxID=330526 RepID=A0AAE0KKW6_9PEZI|nr:hypothetical protein B0H63DRAFT_548573 [Podospora didyma]